MGRVSLLIQVLLMGRHDGISTSKEIDGFDSNPRTGSLKDPVTNFNTLSKERIPLALRPAKKKTFYIIGNASDKSIFPRGIFVYNVCHIGKTA